MGDIFDSTYIAIVDNRVRELRCEALEGLAMDFTAILLAHGSRMDSDMAQRHIVENWHKVETFVGLFDTKAHLYGIFYARVGYDAVGNFGKQLRLAQRAATASATHLWHERAPEV